MKKVIDHRVQESLLGFLQYRTLIDLEAYHNASGQLYRYTDPRTKLIAYGASEAGWVYDKVPDLIKPNIPGYEPGVSGMLGIDYRNGRFLFSGNFPNIPLTGSYTVSEVNFYLTSSTESKIIFETNYQKTPVLNIADSYIKPNNFITPCVFVKTYGSQNEPFALGGENWTVWNYKIIAMMENESQLAGIQKVIRDSYQCMFPIFEHGTINQYGETWDNDWDYQEFARDNDFRGYISDATFQIEESDIFIPQNPKMFVGIGNLEVRMVRRSADPNADFDFHYNYAGTDDLKIFDTDDEQDFVLD